MKLRKILLGLGAILLSGVGLIAWLGMGLFGFVKLSTINYLDASDPAPTAVLAALNDGSAFDPGFMHYPTSLTTEERGQLRSHYEQLWPQLKASVQPGAHYSFVYGTEFEVLASRTVTMPMRHETLENPSRFQFPVGASVQTYMVLAARGRHGETLHIHLLVWPIGSDWKPVFLSSYPAVAHGSAAEDVFEKAKAAKAAGKDLVALALCSLTETLARPMPYFVSGLQHELKQLGEELTSKLGVGERPLLSLTVDGSTVEILNVRGINLSSGFFVELHGRLPALEDNAIMKARQDRVASAFKAAYPEFEKHFKGIAVSEVSEDPKTRGRGFKSVRMYSD